MDYSIKNLKDTNFILYSILMKKYEDFDNNNYLCKRRNIYENEVVERLKKSRESTLRILSQKYKVGKQSRVSFVQESMNCNKDWQICIYDIEYKFNYTAYLILQVYQIEKIEIIENYFFEEINKKPNKNRNEKSKNFIEYNNLLIERRKHKCDSEEINKYNDNNMENDINLSHSIDLREKIIFEKENNQIEEENENIYERSDDINNNISKSKLIIRF